MTLLVEERGEAGRRPPGADPEVDGAMEDLRYGRYMTACARLRAAYASPTETPKAWSFLVWALNAVDPWGEAWSLVPGIGPLHQDPTALRDPLSLVADAMRRHRVVVLMEGHGFPETRHLGARLLPALRAAGATHLAFEAFSQAGLDRFGEDGCLTPVVEPYAFDPTRALLLRTARRLGLRIVAFDHAPNGELRRALADGDWEEENRRREEDMARNVADIVLQDPDARVVVWTGEQHVMKRTPPWYPWRHPFMAAHLVDLLPAEPYCVFQRVVDCAALAVGPRVLTAAAPRLAELGVDAIVYHHRGSEPQRPTWLANGRVAVCVPANGAALVQALPQSEGPDAVPVEQQGVAADAQAVELLLPPGRYLVRGRDVTDCLVWERVEVVAARV